MNLHETTLTSIEYAGSKIAEFRKLRKCLLSEGYQTTVEGLFKLPVDNFIVQCDGSISLSLWNQVGFTWTDNPLLFEILERITETLNVFPESTDYPNSATRMYVWQTKIRHVKIYVYLHVSLAEDGICKRVQVGTRRSWQFVEQEAPEYKFVC